MRIFFLLITTSLFLIGCQQNQSKVAAEQNTNDSNFYPFPQYIMDEISYVDSMPLAIERVVKINGITTDSGFIDKQAFKKEMEPFIAIDPNTSANKASFTETSFNDLSLNAITFSITSQNEDMALQQADILLNAETRQVKNVILKYQYATADSSVQQHLLWKHHMKCQLSELIQHKNGAQYTRTTQYQWDAPLK
jgi:hypothetical protein